MVPIGARACRWIEKYLYTVRPLYIDDVDLERGTVLIRQGKGQKCSAEHLAPYVLSKLMLPCVCNFLLANRSLRIDST
jgi:site-specific recombinase XerD